MKNAELDTNNTKKILFLQNTLYLLTHGGANKANQLLLEGLSRLGYKCMVIASAATMHGTCTNDQLRDKLALHSIDLINSTLDAGIFYSGGLEVHAVYNQFKLRTYIKCWIEKFQPDWIMVYSEDPMQALLEVALEICPLRVIPIIHTIAALPFGPYCAAENPKGAALLRKSTGSICVSEYAREYCKNWGGFEPVVMRFPVYGSGPFPNLAKFNSGYVTIINPSSIKGISIFLSLATIFSDVQFAAVPMWATTIKDMEAMSLLPNISILQPFDDIDELFAITKILIVPSLWMETFGQIVVEAMLRGIPVLASNVGGLPEAKLGIEYILPVTPIARYLAQLDDQMLPIPLVPDQNITVWENALEELIGSREQYELLSHQSRDAAHRFINSLGIEAFDTYLKNLSNALLKPNKSNHIADDLGYNDSKNKLGNLSAKKLALLASRLNSKKINGGF